MKKALCGLAVWGLSVGLACGGSVGLQGGDKFNDGSRDKASWRLPSWRTGRLMETGGHLYLDSWGSSNYRHAGWLWRTAYPLFSGDMLETSVLIHFPWQPLVANSHVALGMGFADGPQALGNILRVTMMDYAGTRVIDVGYFGDDSAPSGYTIFSLPQDVETFYLVMRYNTLTGKVTIWQRAVNNAWNFKVGTVSLNTWWNVPLGSNLTLTPIVYGFTSERIVTPANGVYVDNFAVKMIIP